MPFTASTLQIGGYHQRVSSKNAYLLKKISLMGTECWSSSEPFTHCIRFASPGFEVQTFRT